MSFILALSQKLTGDWSALMSVLLAATAGATAMFMQTNSSITKKAMEEAAPRPRRAE
jgi:hypothetical protein